MYGFLIFTFTFLFLLQSFFMSIFVWFIFYGLSQIQQAQHLLIRIHGSSISMFKMQQGCCKNHKAVQCDMCNKWVHIACNNLNAYTYKKLQKDKSFWYCICCLQKELPYCSIDNDVLNSLLHGNRIVSPNLKFISSVIKQSEYFDEEILEKVNNKYYTPTEFKNALNELSTKNKTFTCI